MIAKVYSAIPYGYDGRIIEVEGDQNKGLPAFNIVGMANKTVSEARERVRSALVNSNFSFPSHKTTINLAPAELNKDGSHLDLPIALTVLALAKQLRPPDLENRLFVGELSLDGHTKPIRGIINIVETARAHGFKEVFLPHANLAQARLVKGIKIYGVSNLSELFLHLKGIKKISPHRQTDTPSIVQSQSDAQTPPITQSNPTSNLVKNTETVVVLNHIKGQALAKRALSIAVAGRHNLLLSGPPGAGKTLLARAAANLLPPPSAEEKVAIAKIHGLSQDIEQVNLERPFRAPHHSASPVSILGGGAQAIPGEISLAHHGILFLDELPEYPRSVLEALRQPLEDGQISIARARQHVIYPARFMLIGTMNPCPCGYLGDPNHECKCTPIQIANYLKKLSGPILDRIDLTINVRAVTPDQLISNGSTPSLRTKSHVKNTLTGKADFDDSFVKNTQTGGTGTEHTIVKNTIIEAAERQRQRYQRTDLFNSDLSSQQISEYVVLTRDAKLLLSKAAKSLKLSARSYFKVIKVAQTISDLDKTTEVGAEQISEALALRQQIS